VDNLEPEQARQVFAHDHVRDAAEQRAWIESHKPQPKNIHKLMRGKSVQAWKVKGRKVEITGPCILTQIDLAQMMMEMG
jgi:hypothetical protein